MKSQEITKLITIHPDEDMNVCTTFHVDPSIRETFPSKPETPTEGGDGGDDRGPPKVSYLGSVQPLQFLLLGLSACCFLDPSSQLGIQLFFRVGFLVQQQKHELEKSHSQAANVCR